MRIFLSLMKQLPFPPKCDEKMKNKAFTCFYCSLPDITLCVSVTPLNQAARNYFRPLRVHADTV